MTLITFIALLGTFLSIAAFYLANAKRFVLVFPNCEYPSELHTLIKSLAWTLIILAVYPWTLEGYKWEVGLARWLTALTLTGFFLIFLAPIKQKLLKILIGISALLLVLIGPFLVY